MTETLIDGLPADGLPLDDRGFLYGDQLFETMLVVDGQVPLWPLHWDRLGKGCKVLELERPPATPVLDEIGQLCRDRGAAVVRLNLTRGSGGRAYMPPETPVCRRILTRRDWPQAILEQRERGLRLMTSPIRLANLDPLRGLKHGNRLEQVLAARACTKAGADEAIMLDAQERLAECIAGNLVVVIGGRALTPARPAVDGVGLAWLMSQPEVELIETELFEDELSRAEHLMVINSVAGIRPARMLNDRPLLPGRLCRSWQSLWNERLTPDCA